MEFGIPIMFDVEATTRERAAILLVERLAAASLPSGTGVLSWWTIEAQDKGVDGNDNDAGLVDFTTRSAVRTMVVAVAADTIEVADDELDGALEFLHLGGRVDFAAKRS